MIEYGLTRSKRKTIGIVVKEGKVFVKAPMRVSKTQIDAFVEENTKWILAKLETGKAMRDRFSDVLEFRRFPFGGKDLTVKYADIKRIKITDDEICLPKNFDGGFGNMIARGYKKVAEKYLIQRVVELSKILNAKYDVVLLSNAKTIWGSCSSNGALRLNWRLILLPYEIIDYVLVHELCHTKELNHSKNFWELVETILPDYKSRRQALNSSVPLIEYCR